MNLYLIWQDINDEYDSYQGAVVCAETEEEAVRIHPCTTKYINDDLLKEVVPNADNNEHFKECWCEIKDVKVKLIGITNTEIKGTVILESFKSG